METDVKLARRALKLVACALVVAPLWLPSAVLAQPWAQSDWPEPTPVPVAGPFVRTSPPLAPAEAHYLAGAQAEAVGNPACIDHYFAASAAAWPFHATHGAGVDDRASALYRSSVQLLIASAQRFGRYHPTEGIRLTNGQLIPITYRGFLWEPVDFHTLLPVGAYSSSQLPTRYVARGVGVPYVVLTDNRLRRPFIRCGQPFAATALVAPSEQFGGTFALEFYDPLRTCVTDAGLTLARDLTAPRAYEASREGNTWLANFLQTESNSSTEGLYLCEPFQSDRIPVVLVHGVASDPVTWSQLVTTLQAQPALLARYQLWLFSYDTGQPFLQSGATLRRQLSAARQTYDPLRTDPQMSRMVLIGHSMGGLLAKLQATYSGNTLWQSAATRPLDAIYTDPTTRSSLASAFYFAPSPDISRVIFIATPHRGSVYATRVVGQISSALIEEPATMRARHAQLIRDNPGAFREEIQRGIPTSVDLLDPESQILQATARLCFPPNVALHTILGDVEWSPLEGPSDGVVAVSSARLLGVQSELAVDAEHTEILRRPETAREVMRILATHSASDPNGAWASLPRY